MNGFEVLRQPIKKLFFTVLTTGWLPWLQTSWRDSGYVRFILEVI